MRPSYPAALLADLRIRVPLDGTARLLDLACGTGQVAFALAADVAEVWAVDQEAESIRYSRRKAQRLGVTNIHWIAATAEDVPLDGDFDLVAIGNAFQRLDRDRVARRLVAHLRERGCVALLWSATPWDGDRPWQRVLGNTFEQEAVGARERVPREWKQAMDRDPHEAVLRRAGLAYEGKSNSRLSNDGASSRSLVSSTRRRFSTRPSSAAMSTRSRTTSAGSSKRAARKATSSKP